jgi:hypothetical protein
VEFLLGNLPITWLWALLSLAPLYGGGALLIREATRLTVAAIVYALIGRFSKHPIRVFRVVALIALLLSFAMPLSAMQFTPPADVTTIVVLLVMHVVAAMITIGMFTTLARTPGDDTRAA